MSIYTSLMASVVLTLSALAHSQHTTSFHTCSETVNKSETYIAAKTALLEQKVSNDNISLEDYQRLSDEVEDFKQYLAIDRCLSGEYTVIYECLIQNSGDFTSCRK